MSETHCETLRVLQYNWSTKAYIYFSFQMSGNKIRFIEEMYIQTARHVWNPENFTVQLIHQTLYLFLISNEC